jgi:acyl carrier protein
MVNKWITAAAAASALSSSGVSPNVADRQQWNAYEKTDVPDVSAVRAVEAPRAPVSERARIVGIANDVRRMVSRFTEKDVHFIVAPRTLAELGVDQVALADIVLGLESRFDIDIGDDEAAGWNTVGDVVAFVAQRSRGSRDAAVTPRA